MSLDFGSDNNRKFQCFICGVEFTDFKEFNNHILENHIEGQDYVICPLDHCKACVRCIRTHFKYKHPKFAIPKSTQLKAMIWKDIKNKKISKKPKFKEGWYESTKMNKKLHYRSGLELEAYKCLDHLIEVNSFKEEAFKIDYIHNGKAHKYVPDIIVSLIDGTIKIIEIKPERQTSLQINKDKWNAAKNWCADRGYIFEVITEKGVELLKKKVRDQNKMSNFFESNNHEEDNDEDV